MQTFTAGIFSVGYLNGFLRYISYGEVEVVRVIYMALRDQNWNTYQPIIENEKVHKHANGFVIRYDCFHELKGVRIFKWRVAITGNSDSEIIFEIEGEAITDVLKNRAGLCILHPIKFTAGAPCEIIQPDGSKITDTFPVSISAENPFKNINVFRWKCRSDWYVLRFEGDVFETEDQRNWSDASYKTFCTPLEKPFPVLLKAGEKVHQKVILKPEVALPTFPKKQNKSIDIVADDKVAALPAIGIAASTETDTLNEEAVQLIRDLNLSHYRIDVQPSDKNWFEKFALDSDQAKALNLPLEIALHISGPGDFEKFFKTWNETKPPVKQIILLNSNVPATGQDVISQAPSFKKLFPETLIGAGTDYNYRELNVHQFNGDLLDFISYSIDPQEHATDDLTIIENIATQSDSVKSARNIYGESKAIHISSLTLRKRFNPAATVASDKFLSNELKADPRQQTQFAAAFTLGSIKRLSFAEANSVTSYQTVGNQGIISASGKKYPVYDVLKEITEAGSHVIHTESSNPLICDALLVFNGQSYKLILVNFTGAQQRVVFKEQEYLLGPYEIKVESQS